MKKRFTEQQIAFALRQASSGTPVTEICRKMNVSEPTFYRWKKQFAGMDVSDMRHLKQEQGRLNAKRDNLLEMRLDGEIDSKGYRDHESRLLEKLAEIEREISILEESRQDTVEKAYHILELCKKLYPLYLAVNDHQKVELLRTVGSKYVLDGRTICGTYRKPFDLLVNLSDRLVWRPLPLQLGTRS